jgi:hypothetical protein
MSSLLKRKEQERMNNTNTKLNRDVNMYSKQKLNSTQYDDDSMRKGAALVERDSVNSSPSHDLQIAKSKFPRN